jgi:NAD(P)-dependent dehydrogenase (short-subunit alcohol dehydrogenase family)
MKPVVLITGGAKRLGSECSEAFAMKGWRVACHFNDSNESALALKTALGNDCEIFKADLAVSEDLVLLVNAVIAHFGQIDCLVNNASMFDADDGITFTPNVFLKHQTVNVLAPLLLAQALATHCQETKRVGCAVHVLDQKVDNLNPDYFSYTVSKLALRDCVKLQAQALAPHLRVLGVSPGLIYMSGPQSEANFKKAASVNLLKTPTDPANVARAIVDLVSNPAINGAIVNVDSGQHLVPLGRDIMFLVDEL